MTTMLAYRLVGWREPARLTSVEIPEPSADQVLVRVAGVGLCHSDLLFLDAEPGRFAYDLPYTMGHEIAGWVERTGTGVTDLDPGDAVVACAHRLCGTCEYCRLGHDNYCTRFTTGLGFGHDGGLAEFVVVDRLALVGPTSLDPRTAGPLADAGKTAYHAVKRALDRLVPGSTAVVIGAGGLGGYAIQYLRLLTACRIVVVDVAEHRLAMAIELGADRAITSTSTVDADLATAVGTRGAEAVFDFVGTDSTAKTALRVVRPRGVVAMVGAGGGTASVSWSTVAGGVDVFIPHGGTMSDLEEVVTLAEQGRIVIPHELFPFDDVEFAYRRLRAGDLAGRAVVLGPRATMPSDDASPDSPPQLWSGQIVND